MSELNKKILKTLEGGQMTAEEIAAAGGLVLSSVRSQLSYLHRDGKVTRTKVTSKEKPRFLFRYSLPAPAPASAA